MKTFIILFALLTTGAFAQETSFDQYLVNEGLLSQYMKDSMKKPYDKVKNIEENATSMEKKYNVLFINISAIQLATAPIEKRMNSNEFSQEDRAELALVSDELVVYTDYIKFLDQQASKEDTYTKDYHRAHTAFLNVLMKTIQMRTDFLSKGIELHTTKVSDFNQEQRELIKRYDVYLDKAPGVYKKALKAAYQQ